MNPEDQKIPDSIENLTKKSEIPQYSFNEDFWNNTKYDKNYFMGSYAGSAIQGDELDSIMESLSRCFSEILDSNFKARSNNLLVTAIFTRLKEQFEAEKDRLPMNEREEYNITRTNQILAAFSGLLDTKMKSKRIF